MALQQSVLLNGEWVTRDLDPLQMFKSMTAEGRTAQQLPAAPVYGLLTKTIIPSPIIRWILPVQLRSAQHNDVAMIGVRPILSTILGFPAGGFGSFVVIRRNSSSHRITGLSLCSKVPGVKHSALHAKPFVELTFS
jgi:hypothetical protein